MTIDATPVTKLHTKRKSERSKKGSEQKTFRDKSIVNTDYFRVGNHVVFVLKKAAVFIFVSNSFKHRIMYNYVLENNFL